jgi:hypothetical protein
MMRSRVCRVLVATAMTLGLVGAGNAASAAPLDLVCPFTANVQFAPGLSLASEPQQLSGFAAAGTAVSSLTPCSSALTGLPYTGLSGPFYGTGTLGCVAVGAGGLAGSANGTIPITWNNGDTSTITWSASLGGIVPTIVARVTEGALLGSNVALVPAPTALSGNCLLAPVRNFSVTGLATFDRRPVSSAGSPPPPASAQKSPATAKSKITAVIKGRRLRVSGTITRTGRVRVSWRSKRRGHTVAHGSRAVTIRNDHKLSVTFALSKRARTATTRVAVRSAGRMIAEARARRGS